MCASARASAASAAACSQSAAAVTVRAAESAGSLPDAPGADLPLSEPSGDLTSADSDYLSGHIQGNVEDEWNSTYGDEYGKTQE